MRQRSKTTEKRKNTSVKPSIGAGSPALKIKTLGHSKHFHNSVTSIRAIIKFVP